MASPLVRLEGARELRSQLRKAGDDLGDLKDANRTAAEIAATASEALAPERSGRLRGTIRASGTKTAGIIRAGYKSVPYAGPIHWGWPSRPDPLNMIYGGPIAAQPFLSDGARNSEGQWLPVYLSTVDGIIENVKGIA